MTLYTGDTRMCHNATLSFERKRHFNKAMKSSRYVCSLTGALISGLALGAGDVSLEQMKKSASESRCEQTETSVVTYTGDSHDLGKCLESLSVDHVRELRINSRGGEVWPTLQTALAWEGRVDSLIVDGLCASSCANYLLPLAKTLIVEPESLILLHGSLNVDQVKRYLEENGERLRREAADAPREYIDREFARIIEEVAEQVKVQKQFAATRIACDDWLDPNRHYASSEIPRSMRYLLVTKGMVQRCLKATGVEKFPDPPRDAARLAELEASGISIATH